MKITIATRGSELALWQARHVAARLIAYAPTLQCELLVIKTTGDKILDIPLADIGGKALFVKEIEQALLDGAADIAVHSMKDVPAELAPGLMLAAITSREVPNDALLSHFAGGLAGLPQGALVGTASVRRQCQLAAIPSDLRAAARQRARASRNGRRRIRRDHLGGGWATRLGLSHHISELCHSTRFCRPRGVLGIENTRRCPAVAQLAVAALHDAVQAPCTVAERSFLLAVAGHVARRLAPADTMATPCACAR
jgi:hydroxymethylbilane synthase